MYDKAITIVGLDIDQIFSSYVRVLYVHSLENSEKKWIQIFINQFVCYRQSWFQKCPVFHLNISI